MPNRVKDFYYRKSIIEGSRTLQTNVSFFEQGKDGLINDRDEPAK